MRYASFYAQESYARPGDVPGALRYDRAWSYFPEVTIGPVRFLPTAIHYDKTPGVTGYNDITPRGGVAWDLFGTGKTSVKLNFAGISRRTERPSRRASPERIALATVTRATDVRIRISFPIATWRTRWPSGDNRLIDSCAQISDLGFGTERFTDLDPKLVSGWGVRPGDWQIGASIQQELFPRVSAEFEHPPLADETSSG